MIAPVLILPGWGIAPEHYRSLMPDAEIFDYGFFRNDASVMRIPGEKAASGKWIIAHSLGTAFALRCAACDPGVKGLILFNPFARFAHAEDFPCGWQIKDIAALQSGIRKNAAVTLKHFYRNCAFPERVSLDIPCSPNIRALEDGLDFLASFDYREMLSALSCPLAVLTSNQDKIVNAEMSLPFASHAGYCRELNDGHFLPFAENNGLDAARKALEVL